MAMPFQHNAEKKWWKWIVSPHSWSQGKKCDFLSFSVKLMLAVGLSSFYSFKKSPNIPRVQKLIYLAWDTTVQLTLGPMKKVACSSGNWNSCTSDCPGDDHHTSVCSRNALCVHLILSPSIREICVNKSWD